VSQDLGDVIVLDNGSYQIKIGFAGDELPKSIFPSVVGRPRHKSADLMDFYVGDEAQKRRDILSINYPIDRGIVTNWDDMEQVCKIMTLQLKLFLFQIWYHIFYSKFKIRPDRHPVLLTETPFNPMANREKMTQIMFETFGTPAMCTPVQAIASLYATGRLTGVVCDCGHGVTHVAPVSMGRGIPNTIMRMNLAGHDVTDFLMQELRKSGHPVSPEAAHNLKEKMCHILKPGEVVSSEQQPFELPDGSIIEVGKERSFCPEILFQPEMIGFASLGIHETCIKSLKKCSEDEQSILFNNIILSGGSSLFPGMAERLQSEVTDLAPPNLKARVLGPRNRKYSVWHGASILASLSTFDQMYIAKCEYDEYGSSIVHRKCD